jgi:hypothetical protein
LPFAFARMEMNQYSDMYTTVSRRCRTTIRNFSASHILHVLRSEGRGRGCEVESTARNTVFLGARV